MSAAMEIHDAIGSAMTVVLTCIACAVPFAAVYFMVRYYLEGPPHDRALDVINSQYISADGKSYDWSKGDLPQGMYGAPRDRIQTAAYRNGDTRYDKDKGVVMPPEPEEIDVDADDMPDESEPDVVEWDTVDGEAIAAKFPQLKILAPKNKTW